MKKLSTYFVPFAFALLATAIVACGKSGGFNGNGNPNGPVVNYNANGVKLGFVTQNAKMNSVQNGPQAPGSSYTINGAGMTNVMKLAMGVCDRDGSNGGLAACSTWLSGFHDMMIFADGSQASTVKLVIRAFPDTRCTGYTCGYYSYSLPSFKDFILGSLGFNVSNNAGIYNPMVLEMPIWPINNSQGFEIRGYAPAGATYHMGNNLMFQFQVANGKLEDAAWDFQFYYNSQPVSSGRMVRCATSNCGVQGF